MKVNWNKAFWSWTAIKSDFKLRSNRKKWSYIEGLSPKIRPSGPGSDFPDSFRRCWSTRRPCWGCWSLRSRRPLSQLGLQENPCSKHREAILKIEITALKFAAKHFKWSSQMHNFTTPLTREPLCGYSGNKRRNVKCPVPIIDPLIFLNSPAATGVRQKEPNF